MPVPKKKTPKSRKGKHRSHQHMRTVPPTTYPQCHSARLPHHVCSACGYYKGREAVIVGEPELPSE